MYTSITERGWHAVVPLSEFQGVGGTYSARRHGIPIEVIVTFDVPTGVVRVDARAAETTD